MLCDSSTKTLSNSHSVFRYITEIGHRDNISICARTGGNEHIYTSNGRHVQIHIDTEDQNSNKDFILEYKGKAIYFIISTSMFEISIILIYVHVIFVHFQYLGALT